jgi:hypothetical protein
MIFVIKIFISQKQVSDFGADKGISRVFETAFEFFKISQAHPEGVLFIHCAAGTVAICLVFFI